jgi:hypothetical protein
MHILVYYIDLPGLSKFTEYTLFDQSESHYNTAFSVGAIQENTNLPIIQMQQILLLTGYVKSKILSHSALPGWSKLFVQSVFDQDRCTLVVFGG